MDPSLSEGDKNGKSNVCGRGHWRPGEDAKLRELVAVFGPQNWNLIADKLEGRSGDFFCFLIFATFDL